jgi:serine/threonine-protein kinase
MTDTAEYITLLVISVAVTSAVGRVLSVSGEPFLQEVFEDEKVTKSVNRLLGPLWAARIEGGDGSGLAMLRLVSLARLDADTRVRLLEAAWQAMEVRDERVISVTDVVASDGELYLVSDYLEGLPLRAIAGLASVRRKPIPVSVALRFITDLMDGAVALHRAMAELGDEAVPLFGGLSADSVLVGADGRTSLLDVAVASAASSVESLGGSPERAAYAAPEQVGAGGPVDPRTDVFSLGALAWEMLERRLFVGSDKGVVQRCSRQRFQSSTTRPAREISRYRSRWWPR